MREIQFIIGSVLIPTILFWMLVGCNLSQDEQGMGRQSRGMLRKFSRQKRHDIPKVKKENLFVRSEVVPKYENKLSFKDSRGEFRELTLKKYDSKRSLALEFIPKTDQIWRAMELRRQPILKELQLVLKGYDKKDRLLDPRNLKVKATVGRSSFKKRNFTQGILMYDLLVGAIIFHITAEYFIYIDKYDSEKINTKVKYYKLFLVKTTGKKEEAEVAKIAASELHLQ